LEFRRPQQRQWFYKGKAGKQVQAETGICWGRTGTDLMRNDWIAIAKNTQKGGIKI
jgi:hypothetical protein